MKHLHLAFCILGSDRSAAMGEALRPWGETDGEKAMSGSLRRGVLIFAFCILHFALTAKPSAHHSHAMFDMTVEKPTST